MKIIFHPSTEFRDKKICNIITLYLERKVLNEKKIIRKFLKGDKFFEKEMPLR